VRVESEPAAWRMHSRSVLWDGSLRRRQRTMSFVGPMSVLWFRAHLPAWGRYSP